MAAEARNNGSANLKEPCDRRTFSGSRHCAKQLPRWLQANDNAVDNNVKIKMRKKYFTFKKSYTFVALKYDT